LKKTLSVKTPIIALMLVLTACSGGENTGMARITERRAATNGRLHVHYEFMAGSTLVADSLEMENRIIPNDSVAVVFNSKNPRENHLQVPEK
jgi:hypothetical protein